MMRHLCTIGLLLFAVSVHAQVLPSKPLFKLTNGTSRVSAKIPDIESIAVFGPPTILGGYSFYADRKGRLIHQSIKPDTEKRYGYVEERLYLREHGELFMRLADHLDATEFLKYREGREYGIPDELRLTFQLTLSNGSKIFAYKWDCDNVASLAELQERVRVIIDAMSKLKAPTKMPYEEKAFGAHARIIEIP